MAATDGAPGATPLLARAPEVFVGDLSGFLALQWDEFVLDHGPATVLSTSVLLRSAAGTVWSSVGTLEVVGAWHVRVVPFVETAWTRRSGSESLSDVLGNVEALFISMDTAYLDHGVLESMVDNIMLVPAVSTSVPAVSAMSWGYAKTSFATAR
jgi:hypothetical protein